MAITKLPIQSAETRGSVGGTSFRIHRGHQVLLSKPHQRRRRLTSQQAVCASHSYLVSRWKHTLTPAQRLAWNRFASHPAITATMRDKRPLSGFLIYLSENLKRRRAGITLLDSAPPVPRINRTPSPFCYIAYPNSLCYTTAGDMPISGEWWAVAITNPFGPATLNPRVWMRWHSYITGPRGSDFSFSLPAPYSTGAYILVYTWAVSNFARHSRPFVSRVYWPTS